MYDVNQLLALQAQLTSLEEQLLHLAAMRQLQTNSTINADMFVDGDAAWMLTASVLVFFMTIPGIMLFYSGMVRVNNVLATAMQSYSVCFLIAFL